MHILAQRQCVNGCPQRAECWQSNYTSSRTFVKIRFQNYDFKMHRKNNLPSQKHLKETENPPHFIRYLIKWEWGLAPPRPLLDSINLRDHGNSFIFCVLKHAAASMESWCFSEDSCEVFINKPGSKTLGSLESSLFFFFLILESDAGAI